MLPHGRAYPQVNSPHGGSVKDVKDVGLTQLPAHSRRGLGLLSRSQRPEDGPPGSPTDPCPGGNPPRSPNPLRAIFTAATS